MHRSSILWPMLPVSSQQPLWEYSHYLLFLSCSLLMGTWLNYGTARILVQMWWSPKAFYCTMERVWFQKEVDVSVYLCCTYAFLFKNWIYLWCTICWFDTQIWWNGFNSQGNIFSHGYHLFLKRTLELYCLSQFLVFYTLLLCLSSWCTLDSAY